MRAPVCRLSDIRLPSGMTWVQTLSVKKNPHCSSKRVGDLDPGVVVYLSWREREGGGGGRGEGTVRPFDAEYDVIVIIIITFIYTR